MFNKAYAPPINGIDNNKVQEIVESILTNGWIGAPILYHSSLGLITGSHRSVALERVKEMYDDDELNEEQIDLIEKIDLEGNYAYDVTDIVDAWLKENPTDSIPYDRVRTIFEGTEVEKWKDDMPDW